MIGKPISPTKETLDSRGKVTYSESLRAWAILRFKKEIIREFSVLKNRQDRFSYQILLHKDFKDLEKEIKKMKNGKEAIPMLLIMRADKKD